MIKKITIALVTILLVSGCQTSESKKVCSLDKETYSLKISGDEVNEIDLKGSITLEELFSMNNYDYDDYEGSDETIKEDYHNILKDNFEANYTGYEGVTIKSYYQGDVLIYHIKANIEKSGNGFIQVLGFYHGDEDSYTYETIKQDIEKQSGSCKSE